MKVTEETAGKNLVPHFDKANEVFADYEQKTLVVMDFEDYMEFMGFEPEVKS